MRKHLELLLIAILTIIAFGAFSQDEPKDPAYAEKMAWFDFLTGNWTGTAEMNQRDGSVTRVRQTEDVQLRLDGTLLQIEGIGSDEDGNVRFNAVANIFYDKSVDAYRMFAFRATGQFTEADIDILGENHFKWYFSPYPNSMIEYEVMVNEEGRWIEKGRFSRDGVQWHPFISMDLEKD